MADPVLHIKDSYYFEVPKVLAPAGYKSRKDFPKVWVKLDPDYQKWEFNEQYTLLQSANADLPPKAKALDDWQHWLHEDHANFAKPFDQYLEEKYERHQAAFTEWKNGRIQGAKDDAARTAAQRLELNDYLESAEVVDPDYAGFSKVRASNDFQSLWAEIRSKDNEVVDYWNDANAAEWSQEKIDAYNHHLSGKILIPQPFGSLRNLYEREENCFAISKFLLIEIFVGLVIVLVFNQLSKRIADGTPPKGRLWNLLEVFLVFIRDQIAKPSLGGHHEEHPEHEEEHGHEFGSPYAEHGQALDAHGHPDHGHGKHPEEILNSHAARDHHPDPSSRFVPLLWTIFFFVLGCNLMGMVPWAGAPTAAFAVTGALACITLLTVLVSGMMQFGVGGFFLNQIPGMDLPWYMAIVIKPMILVIELAGLMIKHGVLAVRLLANMVAGHLVILGIMGLAFGAEAALQFSGAPAWQWGITAVIAVVASAAFNVLELFVAFLQAYIITFLSALFIGAAIHKH